ncbi:MAG: cyclase family protein [archaeon]|nr:cyclase family protein [archaeon]
MKSKTKKMPRWYPSIWGKEDELGAMNLLSAKKITEAARLVKQGRVFNLAHTLEDGMPLNPFHSDFLYFTYRDTDEALMMINKQIANSNKVSYMNLRMEMSDHTGTHVDGLNHVSINGQMYNGKDARRLTSRRGTMKLGMETMPPIFSRGVLADMTLIKKTLSKGAITPYELKKVLKIENVSVRSGEVLLVYTGWEQLWMKNNSKFVSFMPGIDVDTANWLANVGVVAVGSDTQSVEVEPNEDPSEDGIVHQILLAKNGIHLIENMVLSELAAKKVYEFLFVCVPLKIKGGTGSPVSPIAIS